MRYKSMDSGNAQRFLQLRRENNEPPLDSFVETKGAGADYPLDGIERLRAELMELKAKYPEELKQRDEKGGKFEADACAIVHCCLQFNPQVFADAGFWTWLAVDQFSTIIEWRHGGTDRVAALANYGIGNRTENLIYRMWLRADLVRDPLAEDPYWLAKRGDQDLWRSHILRQSYASVRDLAKTFISFQCMQNGNRLSTEGIRELAKRIKRLRANIMFEFLTTGQLNTILTQQANGLALAGTSK